MVSYIHAGVFVPVLGPSADTEKFTFAASQNPSLRLAYWDENAYVSELVVGNAPLQAISDHGKADESMSKAAQAAATEGLLKPSKEPEAKSKKRKVDIDISAGSKKVWIVNGRVYHL